MENLIILSLCSLFGVCAVAAIGMLMKKRKMKLEGDAKSFKSIHERSLEMITDNKSRGQVIWLLKQTVKKLETACTDDVDDLHIIACLLGRPRFNRLEDSIKIWERITELVPNHFEALCCLISIYFSRGQNDKLFEKGSSFLAADYVNGINKRKKINDLMQQHSKLEERCQVAEVEKETSDTYAHLGKSYAEAKETELAVMAFNIAYEIDPLNIDCVHNIGVTYLAQGDYLKALNFFKKYKDLFSVAIKELAEKNGMSVTDPKIKEILLKHESKAFFSIGESQVAMDAIEDAEASFRASMECDSNCQGLNSEDNIAEIVRRLKNKYNRPS